MPYNQEYAAAEALNFALRGGGWSVGTALNIAAQAHRYVQVGAGTRSLLINAGEACYYRWDQSTSDTINTANDLVIPANQETLLIVPYNLGAQPVVHFKALESITTATLRYVEL